MNNSGFRLRAAVAVAENQQEAYHGLSVWSHENIVNCGDEFHPNIGFFARNFEDFDGVSTFVEAETAKDCQQATVSKIQDEGSR